jgi:hypothetical protein
MKLGRNQKILEGSRRFWKIPTKTNPPSSPPPSGRTYRDGNSSVLVRFRLHFLLRALWPLSLDLEENLLQQGIRARLGQHGVPLAAYGTIVSAELMGEWEVEPEGLSVEGSHCNVHECHIFNHHPLLGKENTPTLLQPRSSDQGSPTSFRKGLGCKYFHLCDTLGVL